MAQSLAQHRPGQVENIWQRLKSLSGAWLHAGVLAFYTLLALVMTYPLVLRMGNSVAGEIGDNIYFVFLIGWYQKAWFGLHISPFFDPWLNYPQGWNLASTDTALATTLWGLPASLIAGPTFGYNLAMLLTFIFSGWAMFFWVRHLTLSSGAALVAGMIYAFLPDRFAHFLIGHLNLSGTAWFPLYFMGLYDLLKERGRWHWGPVLLTALSLGLIGFTSMYYLYMTLIISGVFVGAYLLFSGRKEVFDPGLWKRLGAAGLVSLPLVALAVLPFIGLDSQGGLASRPSSYASMYSASPTDFFLPPTAHFLWGSWIGSHFDRSLWIEATLYIGAVSLGLGITAWLGRKASGQALLLKISLAVIVTAFILALGTDFHWLGQRIEVAVPILLQGIVHRVSIPIPMPALLLFRYLPFYSKMRAILRIGFFVLVFTSMMAGVGASWLLKRVGAKRAPAVTLLLLALVFVDFYPGPLKQFAVVEPRPVDGWLAQQPGSGAVMQFPVEEMVDQDQVYNTLTNGKPFVGGFFSANQPEQYTRISPVLAGFPGSESSALLKELGVKWVLFDLARYQDFAPIRASVEATGWKYVTTVGTQAVFEDSSP